MALIDKIFSKKKTLSELSRQELRREEILLEKQRDRLFKKIEQIGVDKQKIFQQGATQKAPELRKSLALQFEMKTQEQLMVARELNLRSKELMTVGRLRMVQENREKGRALGRLNVTEKDVARISGWIEDDAVSQEMYSERLDQILELGEQSDRDALAGTTLKEAGTEIMNIWNDMDRGVMKQDEAFEEADKAARRRSAEKDV
ncbi:MAG TPA: hypothetical protein VGQ99_05330 [Tepidisphaeraceae bacterium]|jgi:hypothetical protein|nr:hypothetical protein [Tepidisphaeraceae bacterium]